MPTWAEIVGVAVPVLSAAFYVQNQLARFDERLKAQADNQAAHERRDTAAFDRMEITLKDLVAKLDKILLGK